MQITFPDDISVIEIIRIAARLRCHARFKAGGFTLERIKYESSHKYLQGDKYAEAQRQQTLVGELAELSAALSVEKTLCVSLKYDAKTNSLRVSAQHLNASLLIERQVYLAAPGDSPVSVTRACTGLNQVIAELYALRANSIHFRKKAR